MRSFRGCSRSRAAALVTVLMVVFAVVLVLLVGANAFSSFRLETVRNNWDDVMRRFPATEANASALELERIGTSLGLNLAPRATERSGPLPEQQRSEFERVKSEVWNDYLGKQMELPRRGELQPPSEVLTSYIASHEEQLPALHAHLAGSSVPVWESDLSRNAAETAWYFSRSLRDSPILISQLIYMAGTRIQLGALRQIPDVDEIWLERLVQHDARASFLTAMKYEGWFWLFLGEAWSGSSDIQLCVADVSDAWRERMIKLEQVAVLCDRELAPEGADLAIEVPRWNTLGGLYIPNLGGAINRLASLELDIELTRLLIEADSALRANEETWPENMSGPRSCTSCPDDLWNYEVNGDALDIALSHDVVWPEQKGVLLPLRLTID